MHGLWIDCVVKSFFENFEQILSRRLKRKIKEKEKSKTDQTISSLFPA
jgi:hypothetical protein